MENNQCYKTIRQSVETGKHASVDSLKFTPDGKYIDCASRNYVEIWDIESGSRIRTIKATTPTLSWVNDVVVSPDGQYIIAGIETVKIKFSSGNLVWEDKATGAILKVDVSTDGKFVVGVVRGFKTRIWDLITGELIDKFKSKTPCQTLALSSDNNYIVFGGWRKAILIWEIPSRTMIRELKTKKLGDIYSLAITPDVKYVISGSHNKLIRVWDFSTGELINTLEGHTGGVTSLAISPDGKSIISGSFDKTIKIWDLSSSQLTRTLTGHEGWVNGEDH